MSNLSVIQNITKVYAEPYPHVTTHQALPEKYITELQSTLPNSYIDSKPFSEVDPSQRIKWKTLEEDKWPISNIWKEFFDYHTSREYFDAVCNLFEPWAKRMPILPQQIKLDERKTQGNFNAYTETQFVRHRVIEQGQTTRTPHLDNGMEIYAGLLYFKHPDDKSTGGGFNIHNGPAKPEFNKKNNNEVTHYGDIVRTCEYKTNAFAMFWNTRNSVHSVEPRQNASHERWSINIIGRYKTNRMW
jgi:hypothetical protein